jgi:hypothetical protein
MHCRLAFVFLVDVEFRLRHFICIEFVFTTDPIHIVIATPQQCFNALWIALAQMLHKMSYKFDPICIVKLNIHIHTRKYTIQFT